MSEQITFREITIEDEAARLWELLSPKQTIYDEWRFRMCFQKYFQRRLSFRAGYVGDEVVGLLPLQYGKDDRLEFFGGDYMEDNRVFIQPGYEYLVREFYQALTGKTHLEYITGVDSFTSALPVRDYKYVLFPAGWSSFEDYLTARLDGEARGKMRRKIRQVERDGVQVVTGTREDMDLLFEMNIATFGEHSAFRDRPFQKEIFHDLLALPYQSFLLTFLVNGEKQGVSFAVLYNGVYEYFNLGVNKELKHMTPYVHMTNIVKAIETKARMFDAFVGDYGWKEHWHLEKIPQYQLIKDV